MGNNVKLWVGCILASLSVATFAGDLTIINNSGYSSTSKINETSTRKGQCSTILGSIGITKPHTTSVVGNITLKVACVLNESSCTADVYMSENCDADGAPKIGTVTLDTSKGISAVKMYSSEFKITKNEAFKITLDGPDPSKEKI